MKNLRIMEHIHNVYLPSVHNTFDLINIALFIHVRNNENKGTNTTNLVQSLMFGTGPTVSRKVDQLLDLKLVERVPNPTDRRTQILRLTESGQKWLADTETSLETALK